MLPSLSSFLMLFLYFIRKRIRRRRGRGRRIRRRKEKREKEKKEEKPQGIVVLGHSVQEFGFDSVSHSYEEQF